MVKLLVIFFFSWGEVGAGVFCGFGHLSESYVLLHHLPLHVRACLHEGGEPPDMWGNMRPVTPPIM